MFKHTISFLILISVSITSAADKAAPVTSFKKTENYKDLISKARHLTVQRDRTQATQVLIRGIQREAKNTSASKELQAALDELSRVFYTDKAQSVYFLAEGMEIDKPREAAEKFNEALRMEEGNFSILQSLARAHLRLGECGTATKPVNAAKEINPYSGEFRLLNIQLASCEKNYEQLRALLGKPDANDPSEKYLKGYRISLLLRENDLITGEKMIKAWEASQPDYPEIYYWKWTLSKMAVAKSPDQAAARRYLSLCQNLTPRKKKSYNLDVELCKSVEKVDEALKSASSEGESDDDSP